MRIYRNSTMDFYYPDRGTDTDIPCIVTLGGEGCVIKYDALEPDGHELFWEWTGQAIEPGHYKLTAHVGCSATLHMFANAFVMDGYWKEQGLHGMWRIKLKE